MAVFICRSFLFPLLLEREGAKTALYADTLSLLMCLQSAFLHRPLYPVSFNHWASGAGLIEKTEEEEQDEVRWLGLRPHSA